jgi:hypothetical protein
LVSVVIRFEIRRVAAQLDAPAGNFGMNWLRSAFVVFPLLMTSTEANAAFQTFTTRASWESAIAMHGGSIRQETFNSIADQSFSGSSVAFADFTVSTNSTANQGADINSIDAAPFGDGGFNRNVDGTTYVLGGYDPGQLWQISFAAPIFAFGWESKQDFDGDWFISGISIPYPNPTFFGVIDDSGSTFSSVQLTGWDSTFGTDNYVYAYPGVLGDYNNDATVDAADYVMWRKNVGGPAGSIANNIDGGPIGEAHFNTWRANFGMTTLGAAAHTITAVPEPASCLMLLIATFAVAGSRIRQSERDRTHVANLDFDCCGGLQSLVPQRSNLMYIVP